MRRPFGALLALIPIFALSACVRSVPVITAPAADSTGGRLSIRRFPREHRERLKDAREAQARFERVRFQHLPWTWGGSGGECDEIIGRFCFWHDDRGEPWEPPPEEPEVSEARLDLIAALDRLAELYPNDGWITGQLVRYRVEAGDTTGAAAAAGACRAVLWWCEALHGFAAHFRGDYAAAERRFDRALAEMPEDVREEWTDVSLLLDGDERDEWRSLRGREREAAARRFWWLADPLYMVPGNDRRSEHFVRLVWDLMQNRARTTEGYTWGDDVRQLLLRYGLHTGWERVRQDWWRSGRPAVVSHGSQYGRQFLPSWRAVERPQRASADAWRIHEEKPRTTYEPPYAQSFLRFTHQLAVFPVGDSSLVVAAFELPPDSVAIDAPVESALILAADESTAPVVARRSHRGPRGTLVATTLPSSLLASIEAMVTSEKKAARARYGIETHGHRAGPLALSDILLTDGAEPPPRDLQDAITRALPAPRVRSGDRVGVFWTVYGPASGGDSLEISVTLSPDQSGWAARLAERIGLRDPLAPVELRWREVRPPMALQGRAVTLAIPQLRAGEYTITLRVGTTGGTAEATRAIQIIE